MGQIYHEGSLPRLAAKSQQHSRRDGSNLGRHDSRLSIILLCSVVATETRRFCSPRSSLVGSEMGANGIRFRGKMALEAGRNAGIYPLQG